MANKASKVTLKTEVKGADKSSSQVMKLTGAIAGLAAGYGALKAAGKAVDFLKSTASAYKVQEKAEKGLQKALQNTTKDWQKQFQVAKDFASSLQKITVVGDETTLGLMRLGLNMGISSTQITQASKDAIGLSSALGIELNSSLKMVALAYKGDYTMLQRYLPALKTLKSSTEKAALVQKTLANGFKMAEADADTLEGAQQQLANSWGDLKESMGEWALAAKPIIKSLTKFFSSDKAKSWASGFAGALGRIIEKLTEVAEKLLGIKIKPEIADDKLVNPKNYSWQNNKEGVSKANSTLGMVKSGRLDNKSANKIIEMLASQDFKGANALVKENLAPKKSKSEIKQDEAKAKGAGVADRIFESATLAGNIIKNAKDKADREMAIRAWDPMASSKTIDAMSSNVGNRRETKEEGTEAWYDAIVTPIAEFIGWMTATWITNVQPIFDSIGKLFEGDATFGSIVLEIGKGFGELVLKIGEGLLNLSIKLFTAISESFTSLVTWLDNKFNIKEKAKTAINKTPVGAAAAMGPLVLALKLYTNIQNNQQDDAKPNRFSKDEGSKVGKPEDLKKEIEKKLGDKASAPEMKDIVERVIEDGMLSKDEMKELNKRVAELEQKQTT